MGKKKTILVVDDDPDYREIASELLEREDFAVAVAADGHGAIEYLSATVPALVLLDLKMPRTDGWAVFAWIKSQPRLAKMPVIIFSGAPLPVDRRALVVETRSAWLEKPVDFDELLEAIRHHI